MRVDLDPEKLKYSYQQFDIFAQPNNLELINPIATQ